MIQENQYSNSKILIVDDEPANIRLLETILKREGFLQLKSVSDSKKAIDIYKEFSPDLVVLDLNMPDPDGFQIMEQLNWIEKESYIPVLVLTAYNDYGTRLRALKYGAKDFLNKPFDIAEVVFRIKNLLEVRLLHNKIKGQNQILEQKVQERTAQLDASHEQLLHAEKLSAIGKLAASIAHEFNNPVLGIRKILEQIDEQTHLKGSLKDLAQLAIKECTRVMDLATKLKFFYRPSSGTRTDIDIHTALEDMMVLKKKNFMEKNIILEKYFAKDIPRINLVEDQFKQVTLNLLQNAEEAINHSEGKIVVTTTKESGNKVKIQIKDNGQGITNENLERIFEPFFTTKSAVKGTGLGLSVSYGIVKKHGGDILCTSQTGVGTTFTLTFPINGKYNKDNLILGGD